MKRPSTDLAALIHSLSASEKRHFKVHTPYSESQYLKLFDLILLNKPYDEAKLLERMQAQGVTLHLPVAKRQLYFLLLSDLVNTQKEKVDFTLRREIHFVQVLLERGFVQQAKKLLQRNKKRAQQFELYRLLLEYLELEKRLLGNRGSEQEIDQIYQLEQDSFEKLHNESQYWYLSTQIGRLQWQYQRLQGETQKQALENLGQHPLLQAVESAQSLQSKIYYYRAKSTYYFTLGKPEEAYQLNEELLKLIESSDYYQKQFPETYLLTFNNFLIDSLLLKKFDALQAGLEKLTSLHKAPALRGIKNLKARTFRQRFMLEVNWYLATGAIKKGVDRIPAIEAGLKQFGEKIEKPHRITLRYLAAYLLFLDKNYNGAQYWLLELLREREDVVQEIFRYARLLNLLVHFELENWEHLSSLILSIRRYIKQRGDLSTIEQKLMRYLQKYPNLPDAKEQQLLTQAFLADLEGLKAKPEARRFFNYIDLKQWLNQKH